MRTFPSEKQVVGSAEFRFLETLRLVAGRWPMGYNFPSCPVCAAWYYRIVFSLSPAGSYASDRCSPRPNFPAWPA